jgi:hypothetical protein
VRFYLPFKIICERFPIITTPLPFKKSFAKKIFGLNLTLQAHEARGVAEKQWASIAEAHYEVGKKSISRILVDRAGFEPATSTLQMWRSTTKLTAHHSARWISITLLVNGISKNIFA